MRSAALPLAFLTLTVCLLALGCGDDDAPPAMTTPDAGVDCLLPEMAFAYESVGATAGIVRHVSLELGIDACVDADIEIESSAPGVATVPDHVSIAARHSEALVDVTALAVGSAVVTARWKLGAQTREATLEVVVTDGDLPLCSGTASGDVAPGGEVTVAAGATLAGSRVAVAAGAARDDELHVAPFHADITCAADQLPDGYRAIGPAVSFAPAHLRFLREIEVAIPIRLSLLPADATRAHVEVSYKGPGVASPRIVPIASPSFSGSPGDGLLTFVTPRLGTYQAVTRTAGPTKRMRTFKFSGVIGFSMGGGASAFLGLHNLDRFDFAGPLGGPADWSYMLNYVRTYFLGGFCTAEERATDATCANGSSVTRTPVSNELYEHAQDYEHWWYVDAYGGQGGVFDRHEYIQIFRDLTMMYGNANTDRTTSPTEPNITPPGVPDSVRLLAPVVRCTNPVRIAPYDGTPSTGYFDDEYNPDGLLPVITFCDGAEVVIDGARDAGVWDPEGANDAPLENAVAVDVNSNGWRDRGEPVIRAGYEPYDDFGLDGVADALEPGYDATTNPDPNGDDYDFQFNPAGTEKNHERDGDPCTAGTPGAAEPFFDAGLDGVMGTAQLDVGGFDRGEGNGCFDMASGSTRMMDRNPSSIVARETLEHLRDLDVLGDGGIRDLFNFAATTNHFMGSFAARGLPVRFFDGHASLGYGAFASEDEFSFIDVPWNEIGKYAMVRYGDPDATEGLLVQGDGGHVGTSEQAVNRLLGGLAWMSARWPGGDRTRVTDRLCAPDEAGCEYTNTFSMDFTAPTTGRTGPVSIVLPPGYFAPENAELRYPVVYFLHGYGMQPQDLIVIGNLMWTYMIQGTIPEAKRLQKMIFVFPDGRCRGSECTKGTFYADAPPGTPGGAQIETWMLDLMDYVDATFRTRSPEPFEVVE